MQFNNTRHIYSKRQDPVSNYEKKRWYKQGAVQFLRELSFGDQGRKPLDEMGFKEWIGLMLICLLSYMQWIMGKRLMV